MQLWETKEICQQFVRNKCKITKRVLVVHYPDCPAIPNYFGVAWIAMGEVFINRKNCKTYSNTVKCRHALLCQVHKIWIFAGSTLAIMFDTSSSSSLFLFFKGLDSKCVLIRNCTAAGSCFMCCSLGAETLHSKLWKNTSYANDVVKVKLCQ